MRSKNKKDYIIVTITSYLNALIQQLLLQLLQKSVEWYLIRPLHAAEKHHPTMFRTATVRHKRWGPNILYNTSLSSQVSEYRNWRGKKNSLD